MKRYMRRSGLIWKFKNKRAFPDIDMHPFKGLDHGEIMANKALLIKELKDFIE